MREQETIYVCPEPEPTTAYSDLEGCLHATRDEAIARNFELDRDAAFRDVADSCFTGFDDTKLVIEAFLRRYPSLARVLLEDRNPT